MRSLVAERVLTWQFFGGRWQAEQVDGGAARIVSVCIERGNVRNPKAHMPTVQVDGTQLEYIERGKGEPVVLVHGTLGDYRSWQLQMGLYSETYRTISYSRRYHHPNQCQGDETDYSAALHADDLASLITGLGLDSAYVVGNSYGAYTALLLAARHPQRVRGLVLGDPPVFPLLDHIPEGRTVRDGFLTRVWERAGDLMRQERPGPG